tara:strand:+ start:133 stop:396 length:264 start_codon:yes stop_codon:yes gene_type:complete
VQSEYLGYIAAILTTIAFLPQLFRTYRTKSADDVSIVMLLMFITGLMFWIFYGLETNAKPVLIANIITLILNLGILILKIDFMKKTN